jgi:hypothetical protein
MPTVYVMTCTELGWDCVVGVYTDKQVGLKEHGFTTEKEANDVCYIFHEQTITSRGEMMLVPVMQEDVLIQATEDTKDEDSWGIDEFPDQSPSYKNHLIKYRNTCIDVLANCEYVGGKYEVDPEVIDKLERIVRKYIYVESKDIG